MVPITDSLRHNLRLSKNEAKGFSWHSQFWCKASLDSWAGAEEEEEEEKPCLDSCALVLLREKPTIGVFNHQLIINSCGTDGGANVSSQMGAGGGCVVLQGQLLLL